MSLSARDHGQHAAIAKIARLLALALIALVGVSPIASSRHDLTVRHVVCAEHGELTHARASSAHEAEPESGLTTTQGDTGAEVDAHEHCGAEALVRQRMHGSVIRSVIRYTPPPTVVRKVRQALPDPGRAFVLASAPKTSPPSA
jgi:hypothetical protein